MMKIQKLFILAILASFVVPQISAEEVVEIGDPALMPEAVVNQDEAAPVADIFKLFKNEPAGFKINGWLAVGNGALADHNPNDFRLSPGTTGLNQLGFSMDKAGEKYRLHLDLLYGRDAGLFRSFSNNDNGWDNSTGFEHNGHAWALPQTFVETSVGDLTVKGGHFLMNSDAGLYSTNRFFATRTVSEATLQPFTLTGVVVGMEIGEIDATVGWAAGTNTGFDSMTADGSSTFVIGATRGWGENLIFSYDALIGDIGDGNLGGQIENSYYHVISASYTANKKLAVGVAHVYQNDPAGDRHVSVVRQTAYYVLGDTMTLGQRYENARLDGQVDETVSVGINYKRTSWANTVLRPEIRWGRNSLGQQTEFFMDVVVTF